MVAKQMTKENENIMLAGKGPHGSKRFQMVPNKICCPMSTEMNECEWKNEKSNLSGKNAACRQSANELKFVPMNERENEL